MKIKYLAIILALIMVFACFSCGKKNNDGNGNSSTESGEFHKTDATVYEIYNPVCPLKYSVEWKDYVVTEVTEISGGCIVNFTAILEAKNIPLFSFVLSDNSDTGDLLGVIETKQGKKNVYLIDLFDREKSSELSEEAMIKYDTMCFDVNVIISNLVYDNNMIFAD